MKLNTSTRRSIEIHAIEEYLSAKRECCGLVVAQGNRQRYVPCENSAQNDNDFKISGQEYARAEEIGEVLAVVHSHIERSAEPTELDLVSCEAHGLPWHIIAVGTDAGESKPRVLGWSSFLPSGYVAPLVGRTFHHGSLDCYGLIVDCYERELGITLPNFERPDKWWDDPALGELYLDNFRTAGFEPVDSPPQPFDVVLMQYRSNATNHGGVFLGDAQLKSQPGLHEVPNALLHHAMPRLSERVMYAGYWRDVTRMIVRHKDLR